MDEQGRDDVFMSLQEALAGVQEEATTNQSNGSTPAPIFKVPQSLRFQFSSGDDSAFIPEVVSLGPYHFGEEYLSGMEYHKTRALKSVLTRSNKPLEYYLDPMYELVEEALHFYEGPILLSNHEFVKMLLLDGCFILEIIQSHQMEEEHKDLGYSPNDYVFARKGYKNMTSSIIKDMIKLENQIPLFVLVKLFDLQLGRESGYEVAQLSAFMFVKWLTGETLERPLLRDLVTRNDVRSGHFVHCLSVLQACLFLDLELIEDNLGTSIFTRVEEVIPAPKSATRTNTPLPKVVVFYSANELIEHGIRFKRPERARRLFWDVRFKKNGVLEMPRIFINNRFKVAFKNLIILEQKSTLFLYPLITEYVTFMDKLINSANDVGPLNQAGIIVHHLRSDADVAELFNDLGKLALLSTRRAAHYTDLYTKLDAHCNRLNHWKYDLKHTYFRNPWALASVIAAIVLLLLSFLQTFYTIYPYYRPRSHS